MNTYEKSLKKLLNGLTMLYIHIKTKPNQEHFIDVLLSFNRALLQLQDVNASTLKSLNTAIKSISEEYYLPYKGWMSRYCQEDFHYDYKRAIAQLDALIIVNRGIVEKLEKNEWQKARDMAFSVMNYPDYLLGRYDMAAEDFFENELCYYGKKYDEFFLNGFAKYFFNLSAPQPAENEQICEGNSEPTSARA